MNILKSLYAVSIITMFSRILGFIRDILIARIFGVGLMTDAFFIAFKLPNFLRRIFAEGAFSQAFIPILVEYRKTQEKSVVRAFIAHVSGLLIFILVFVILLGVLTTPFLISIFAPGFINIREKFTLTIDLARITFPYIFFISLSSLIGAILNTWNIFLLPSIAPILLNISIIIFAMLATSFFYPPIMALAWSVIVGGILQLVYQLPYLSKIGMLVIPHLNFFNFGIWRILKSVGTIILGVSVNQISLLINTIFASFLVSGSVSWIYYADRLMEFPVGILGVSLSTVLLPLLSRSFSDKNLYHYSCLMDWSLRICFILSLPSALLLGVLAKPLVIVLFQYGNFSSYDVLMTKQALVAYSIGLVGLILVRILSSAFYSSHNIQIPVRISFIVLILTQLMNIAFIIPLKHVGLSLAISLSACCNAGLLYWQLRANKIFKPQPGWLIFFLRILLALGMMLIVTVTLRTLIIDWTTGGMLYRFLRLMSVISVSFLVYFISLWFVGIRLKDFLDKFRFYSFYTD
ncbi:murein biosynthesis integral membrane protein MurJ [Blochmannia endosymbiont of Colobopsis nipponica]|uniref:murein biosynthesis integral membrane protein MurJ n=1 Tax=Blochmannia endosymbiont of Colobopsis nipponica TaxID=2681987 RepID=UPI001781A6A7|nr:murein biosynthesis integral membrane protein MurJ [Blochmannia endosymbiont of Colobopsis nipponica]QOI11004.1 murein biosynthesis integral membrane protein MurJ [Blochmannia endosymbiont of Colobopsis nipponica]